MSLPKVKKLDLADFPQTSIANKINEVNVKLEEFDNMIDSIINSASLDQTKVDALVEKIQAFDTVLIEDDDVRQYMLEQIEGEGRGFDDVREISSAIQEQVNGRIAFLMNQRAMKKSEGFDELKAQLENSSRTNTEKAIEQTMEAVDNQQAVTENVDFSSFNESAQKRVEELENQEEVFTRYAQEMNGKKIDAYKVRDEYTALKDYLFSDTDESSFINRARKVNKLENGMNGFVTTTKEMLEQIKSGTFEYDEQKASEVLSYVELALAQSGLDTSVRSSLNLLKKELKTKPVNQARLGQRLEKLGVGEDDLRKGLKLDENREQLVNDVKKVVETSTLLKFAPENYRDVILRFFEEPNVNINGIIRELATRMQSPEMEKLVDGVESIENMTREYLTSVNQKEITEGALRVVEARINTDRQHYQDMLRTADTVGHYDSNAETQRSDEAPRLDLSMMGLDPNEARFPFGVFEEVLDENGNPVMDAPGDPRYEFEANSYDPRDVIWFDENSDEASNTLANDIWEEMLTDEQRLQMAEHTAENPPFGAPILRRGRLEGLREFFMHHRPGIFGGPALTRREELLKHYSIYKIKQQIERQGKRYYDEEQSKIHEREENELREIVHENFVERAGRESIRATLDKKGNANREDVVRESTEGALRQAMETENRARENRRQVGRDEER